MALLPPSATDLSHATALIGFNSQECREFVVSLQISPYDTSELNAAEAGGIKDVRDFTTQLLMSPQFGDIRLGIIFQADRLTPQAQNALLKILEEPPTRIKIVLCIDTESAVLPTVLSRCQRFHAKSVAHTSDIPHPLEGNALDRFNQAEELAKQDDLRPLAAEWLLAIYQGWCKNGKPSEDLPRIESAWAFYRGIEQGRNKRLLLEQLVVSSL